MQKFLCWILLCLGSWAANEIYAQRPPTRPPGSGGGNITYDRQGRPIKNNSGNDSLARRDVNEDSITIHFKFFNSTSTQKIDSSVNDFNTRFPRDFHGLQIGNTGSAYRSVLFQPLQQAGWDHGFHVLDRYRFTLQNTPLYQTTRPYSEIAYSLGARAEQFINFLHTQNKKSNFNFSIEYRFINSPGQFKNQSTSHNNFRFTSAFESLNKRYHLQLIYLSNKLSASENGGIVNDSLLDDPIYNDRFLLETRLGANGGPSRNFFSTKVSTGNIYKQTQVAFRQQYDFGQKDELKVDTLVYKLFYPRLRLQHDFIYNKQSFTFLDYSTDSVKYNQYFAYNIRPLDSVMFQDNWQQIENKFSIITFPDKKNQLQFLETGMSYQLLQYSGNHQTKNFYNIYAFGTYKNRTRNKIWDVDVLGVLYLNGLNSGDYLAKAHLQKNTKMGATLNLGFLNVNRSPSFNQYQITSFPIQTQSNLKKENTTKLSTEFYLQKAKTKLFANYFLSTNYIYYDSLYTIKQSNTLFNVLMVGIEKQVKLSKHWNWYIEAYIQQKTGNAPVNLPLLVTRNRFAFEGVFYKNLNLSTGIEARYISNFKADGYNPLTGQFYLQDLFTIQNRPDIHAFLHFRIKSFKGFIRAENLNSFKNQKNNIGFTKHNYATAFYPLQTLWMRLGIWWSFVN